VRQRTSSRPKPTVGAGRLQATSALDAGLRLLGRRAHSQAELRRKLDRRGYTPDQTEAALSRLIELGYLDDRSFAEGLVRRRGAIRGPLALSAELAARGVDRAHADQALAGFDAEAQLAAATRLAERLSARKPQAGYRDMLNAVGPKLMRRGFSANVVRAACRAALPGTED
jgi:regulatory protein